MNTSLITVVQQHDVLCKAMQELHLMNRECCAGIGNNVFQSTLVHGDHIGIAFHHIDTILFDDSLLGLIDAIEFSFFMIDFRIGRIDILLLNALRGSIQFASAESHYLSTDVKPREDGSSRKAVDKLGVGCWVLGVGFANIAQAGLDEKFILIALSPCFVAQGIALGECET